MKFRIKVAKKESPQDFWWEEYTKNIDDPHQWGREIIEYYNNTRISENDPERVFLDAEVLNEIASTHKWEKINLITQTRGGCSFDRYLCLSCGITGKRFGISEKIQRDAKYKAKVYSRCDTAVAQLAMLKKRKEHNQDMARMRQKWKGGA